MAIARALALALALALGGGCGSYDSDGLHDERPSAMVDVAATIVVPGVPIDLSTDDGLIVRVSNREQRDPADVSVAAFADGRQLWLHALSGLKAGEMRVLAISAGDLALSCADGMQTMEIRVEAVTTQTDADESNNWIVEPIVVICHASSEPSCSNGQLDYGETEVDCGGACPPCTMACAPGSECSVCEGGADCPSGVCNQGLCQSASCSDGVRNGDETDTDCGGSLCVACAAGAVCDSGADCATGNCQLGHCEPPDVCLQEYRVRSSDVGRYVAGEPWSVVGYDHDLMWETDLFTKRVHVENICGDPVSVAIEIFVDDELVPRQILAFENIEAGQEVESTFTLEDLDCGETERAHTIYARTALAGIPYELAFPIVVWCKDYNPDPGFDTSLYAPPSNWIGAGGFHEARAHDPAYQNKTWDYGEEFRMNWQFSPTRPYPAGFASEDCADWDSAVEYSIDGSFFFPWWDLFVVDLGSGLHTSGEYRDDIPMCRTGGLETHAVRIPIRRKGLARDGSCRYYDWYEATQTFNVDCSGQAAHAIGQSDPYTPDTYDVQTIEWQPKPDPNSVASTANRNRAVTTMTMKVALKSTYFYYYWCDSNGSYRILNAVGTGDEEGVNYGHHSTLPDDFPEKSANGRTGFLVYDYHVEFNPPGVEDDDILKRCWLGTVVSGAQAPSSDSPGVYNAVCDPSPAAFSTEDFCN